jgi:hypothetical protein
MPRANPDALAVFVIAVFVVLALVAAYHHGRLSGRNCAVDASPSTGSCSARCS